MAALSSSGEKHFVDQCRWELIQYIPEVNSLLDHLLQKDLLTQEQYDAVRSQSIPQEKIRALYTFIRGWSWSDKDILHMALKTHYPRVIENLEDKVKIGHGSKLMDFKKEYIESVKERFQRFTEYNSRMGEAVNLQKRYINLVMRKGPKEKEGKVQEIRCLGRKDLQIIEKKYSDEHSTTTIQALFDPDEDDYTSKIVVLQGPAGIGKTMTSKKILLDWASDNFYPEKFNFVFYLSCREINLLTGNINLVGLISRTCRLQCSDALVSVLKYHQGHKNLLFIIDGFDELKLTLDEQYEASHDLFEETHKEILLKRLLRKEVLRQSSLIITTRSVALKKLNRLIEDSSLFVEIQGFTRSNSEEYVLKFFGNKNDADKAISIIQDNEVLYTMSVVPIICWIVCTVLKKEIKKDIDSMRCKTVTSIYLHYLEILITHHNKEDQSVHPLVTHQCLKKLCALANEGILNQQILFEDKDLQMHGLSLSEVESVFLNENIFHWDVRTQTCYSFIHLSVQEFLAALYYVLLNDVSGDDEDTSLPQISKRIGLSHISSEHPHLSLVIQFLFGLLNTNEVKAFSESTGINISLSSRSAMKEWAMKEVKWTFPNHSHTIFCLYETQDEDFVRSIMSYSSYLNLQGTGHLWMDSNYSKQLAYCLKTLKGNNMPTLEFTHLKVYPKCQKNLSPLLHMLSDVRFVRCAFPRDDYCEEIEAADGKASTSEENMKPASLSWLINPESKIQTLQLFGCGLTFLSLDVLISILITNRSLSILNLSYNNLQDCLVKRLHEILRDPEVTLEGLSLCSCELTSACCDDLRSIFITNQCLTTLDLSYNDLQESGLIHLCEGLRHPDCMLKELRLCKCGLTSSCCELLRSVLITSQSLITLDISRNCLQDSGIKLLFDGLRDPGCTLQNLHLRGCGLTPSCCDDLYPIITRGSLSILDLTDNDLKAPGIHRLCEGLKDPGCTLQDLSLCGCNLTQMDCDDLYSVLTTNRSLTSLDLSRNSLKNAGVKRLCEGLRHPNCTLHFLKFELCDATLRCRHDLSSVITTKKTQIKIQTTLRLRKNTPDSEENRYWEFFQRVGFVVEKMPKQFSLSPEFTHFFTCKGRQLKLLYG